MSEAQDTRDEYSGVTTGFLIEQLKHFPPDTPVSLGPKGHFTFYRVKDRGGVAQIEFNEALNVQYFLASEHPEAYP